MVEPVRDVAVFGSGLCKWAFSHKVVILHVTRPQFMVPILQSLTVFGYGELDIGR